MKKIIVTLTVLLLLSLLPAVCAHGAEGVTTQFCEFAEDILFLKPDGTLWVYDRKASPNKYNVKDISVTKIWDGVKKLEYKGLDTSKNRNTYIAYIITTDNTLCRLEFDERKIPPKVYKVKNGIKDVYTRQGRNGVFAVSEDNKLLYWGDPGLLKLNVKDKVIYASDPYLVEENVKEVAHITSYDVAYIKTDNSLWGISNMPPWADKTLDSKEKFLVSNNVAAVHAYGYITTDGSLYRKTEKSYIKVGDNVISASSSYDDVHFVTSDGTLWVCERDGAPSVENDNVLAVVGDDDGYIALKKDGWLWRLDKYYKSYYYPDPLQCVRVSSLLLEGDKYLSLGEHNLITATYYDENGYKIKPYDTKWTLLEGDAELVAQGDQVSVIAKKGGLIRIQAQYNPTGEVTQFEFFVKDYTVEISGRKPIKFQEETELTASLYSGGVLSNNSAYYTWEVVEKDLVELQEVYGAGSYSVKVKAKKSGIATVRVSEKLSGITQEFKLLVELPPNIKIYESKEKDYYGVSKVNFTVVNEKYPQLDYDLLTEEEYKSLTLINPQIKLGLPKGLYAASAHRVNSDYTKEPDVYVYEDMIPGSRVDFSFNFAYGDEALKNDDAFVVVSVLGKEFLPYCKAVDLDIELPIKVFVNGEKVEFDALPVIRGGRTLVPVRKIFNALGTADEDILWDENAKKVTATVDGRKIELLIDKTTAYVDGEEKTLDVPATILPGNRTYVPIRFIAESFGAKVHWNDGNYTVSIMSGQKMESEQKKISEIKPDKNGQETGFTTEEKEKWLGYGETYNVYNGGEFKAGTYYVENLVIKEPMTLPPRTKICVSGYLNIENKVTFGKNSGIYVAGGDVTVKKKGLLDMREGGTLDCEKNFVFNSGTNHNNYLTAGTIIVGGNLSLKKNFFATEKNELRIANKQELHTIDIGDDKQQINIFRVEERGFEVLDIKKSFGHINSMQLDDWSVLEQFSFGNVFELTPFAGVTCNEKIKERVETGLLFAFASENVGGDIDFGKMGKLTENMNFESINETVSLKYYDDRSNEIKDYTLTINYMGAKQEAYREGFGMVTYNGEDGVYRFAIYAPPEKIEEILVDFKATITSNVAKAVVEAYKSNYVTPVSNNAKNFIKALILEEMPDNIGEMLQDGEDVKKYLDILKKITDDLNKLK